jgi:hypothetical protein
LPFHAHSLPALKKGFSVCGGLSRPQHRHPVTKKAKKNGFFAPLGCLELHKINTNALWLFAHFFRRLPKGIYLKKQHYRIGNLPKKSSARLKLISQNQS